MKQFHHHLLFSSAMAAFFLLSTACQKNMADNSASTIANAESSKITDAAFIMNNYADLSFQTKWELQQARAATAKYKNLNNALADGYVDIEVDVENMGHHFMKLPLVDEKFDLRHPEILVYNKDDKGIQQLVAVEYAIPYDQQRPEGFTGENDVWDYNTGFKLWLLHAWVWSINPDGVFKPLNPLVHLH